MNKSIQNIADAFSLIAALKNSNKEQIELINKLIADCSKLEKENKFLRDIITANEIEMPKLN